MEDGIPLSEYKTLEFSVVKDFSGMWEISGENIATLGTSAVGGTLS